MKAILLVRVSTEAQDFTEQEKEIYQMAINDGYKPEDIIAVCEKESGIKLEEEDRAGLNRMKELIESGIGVNCVYCWEVSRIARRKKINFSVLEYLTNHKVQLIIKNPYITLFNPDGTINDGAETTFTLFAQIAESEMRTKKARFKRSKDARRKDGYFTGGFVLYGYTTDANKKLIVKDDEAEIVKMLFTMYLSGRYSYRSLAKEVMDMGIFTDKSYLTAQTAISKILNNYAYAGLPSSEGNKANLRTEGNIYPALVTKEMVDKVKAISQKNIIEPKKKYSTYYFGKGILRCPDCGKIMMAVKARNFYHCTKCGCKTTININMVDSALWAVAAPLYTAKMQNKAEGQKEYYESQILLLEQKIDVAQKDIEGMRTRADKVERKAYIDGTMSEAKAEAFIAEINAKIDTRDKEIAKFRNQMQDFQNLLLQYTGDYEGTIIDDVASITDEKVRYDIVHQMIEWASIERVDGYKMRTIIRIYDKEGKETKYLLDSRSHKIYSKFTPDGIGTKEVEGAFEERFAPSYLRSEEYKAYQKEYRESHTDTTNAERQRKYRKTKKADEFKIDDVVNCLHIGINAARSRVKRMVKDGAVAKCGEYVENGTTKVRYKKKAILVF